MLSVLFSALFADQSANPLKDNLKFRFMISINKTAYPLFQKNYSEQELDKNFRPTKKKLEFISKRTRKDASRFTLLTLLKSHQHLGYLVAISTVPKSICQYLLNYLGLSKDLQLMESTVSNKKTFYRYRKIIRTYLGVFVWSDKAIIVVEASVKKAAFSISNPADLVNVAIEQLIKKRYELPAFSTLDRMVGRIRHQVHLDLYQKLNSTLSSEQQQTLNGLLLVNDGKATTDFNRLCQTPSKPALTLMRDWTRRLAWLEQLMDTARLFGSHNSLKSIPRKLKRRMYPKSS